MRCKECRYSLKNLTERRCPECGRIFDPDCPATFEAGGAPQWPNASHTMFIGVGALVISFVVIHFFINRSPHVVDPAMEAIVVCGSAVALWPVLHLPYLIYSAWKAKSGR